MIKISYMMCIIFIILLIFIWLNNIKEHFNEVITTWTPYYLDVYNQPGYTNYLYRNGYMYPVY